MNDDWQGKRMPGGSEEGTDCDALIALAIEILQAKTMKTCVSITPHVKYCSLEIMVHVVTKAILGRNILSA